MKLKEAKLCVQCEEIHQEARCPRCLSDQFVWLGRSAIMSMPAGRVRVVDNLQANGSLRDMESTRGRGALL